MRLANLERGIVQAGAPPWTTIENLLDDEKLMFAKDARVVLNHL